MNVRPAADRPDHRRRASVDGQDGTLPDIAQNAAIHENAVVAVFSLEMSKEQLVMRMLALARPASMRIVSAPGT